MIFIEYNIPKAKKKIKCTVCVICKTDNIQA